MNVQEPPQSYSADFLQKRLSQLMLGVAQYALYYVVRDKKSGQEQPFSIEITPGNLWPPPLEQPREVVVPFLYEQCKKTLGLNAGSFDIVKYSWHIIFDGDRIEKFSKNLENYDKFINQDTMQQ